MLFCQLDYPQELGTKTALGKPISIAMAGCALCSVTSMLANVFGKDVTPLSMNDHLNQVNGFASNGEGDFDLIDWTAINRVFPDIAFIESKAYYNPPAGQGLPADMSLIDQSLEKGFSVIVGVSFNHYAKEPTPTHYVELYRKNPDGTYQVRDSMFRGEEADTVFDNRYAVNGMTVPECILQAVFYTGTLPEQQAVVEAYYKPGDEIRIDTDVATGASPDTISFNYGKISMQAPARVLDIVMEAGIQYYHIDQTYIGGGTGYALVTSVDDHAIKATVWPGGQPAQPVQPTADQEINIPLVLTQDQVIKDTTPVAPVDPIIPVMSQAVTPEEKVVALTQEKNDLVAKLKDVTDKYKMDLDAYSGIVALGFTKAEDLIKHLEGVASENTGLKKQMVEVLKRNKAYHLDMAAKEEEDATAIEAGMKYEQMYKEVRNDLSSIAKVFKTTPTINAIVSAAERIRVAYEQVVKQLKNKEVKQAAETAVATIETMNVQQAASGLSLLEKMITFNFKKGGI